MIVLCDCPLVQVILRADLQRLLVKHWPAAGTAFTGLNAAQLQNRWIAHINKCHGGTINWDDVKAFRDAIKALAVARRR